jgi:hypothetical protein
MDIGLGKHNHTVSSWIFNPVAHTTPRGKSGGKPVGSIVSYNNDQSSITLDKKWHGHAVRPTSLCDFSLTGVMTRRLERNGPKVSGQTNRVHNLELVT